MSHCEEVIKEESIAQIEDDKKQREYLIARETLKGLTMILDDADKLSATVSHRNTKEENKLVSPLVSQDELASAIRDEVAKVVIDLSKRVNKLHQKLSA